MITVMIYEWWSHREFTSTKALGEIAEVIEQIRSDGYIVNKTNEIGYMAGSVSFDNIEDAIQFKLTYL